MSTCPRCSWPVPRRGLCVECRAEDEARLLGGVCTAFGRTEPADVRQMAWGQALMAAVVGARGGR